MSFHDDIDESLRNFDIVGRHLFALAQQLSEDQRALVLQALDQCGALLREELTPAAYRAARSSGLFTEERRTIRMPDGTYQRVAVLVLSQLGRSIALLLQRMADPSSGGDVS